MPADPEKRRPRGQWAIKSQPHVAMRLKRMFPRVEQTRQAYLLLADTAEVARDLEMILTRWPMKMNADAEDRLNKRAEEHRAQEDTVARLLSGHTLDMGWREPAIPAREYQVIGADLALSSGRLLCADDVGLGKSLTGLLALRNPEALPALVVTLTHLPEQWLRELEKFFPWLKGHVLRGTKPYEPAEHRSCKGVTPDVLITSYSKLNGWADHLRGTVRTVIFDEMQELRHGQATNRGMAAAKIADSALFRIGLTATPVYNYGGEMHNILSILDQDALGTRSEFLREWCGDASIYGDERKVMVSNPRALGTYLREIGLMIRRTREEVGRELPECPSITQHVPTDHKTLDALSGDAADLAELLLTGSRDQRFRAAGDLDWRMRHATGVAKAPYVAEFVRLLLESEKNLVLFGWHRDVYDIWLEKLKEFRPMLYTGTESPAAKDRSARAFMAEDSRVLIMSLRSGAGLDGLQDVTRVGVFGELDWSPGVHTQCVGRYHRDGQRDSSLAYYLVSEGGADPVMVEALGLKRAQSEPILDPDAKTFNVSPGTAHADRLKRLAEDVLRRRGRPVPVRQVGTPV